MRSELMLRNSSYFNPLNANPTKWSNTLKQFVVCCRRIVFSMYDHFVRFVLKGLCLFFGHSVDREDVLFLLLYHKATIAVIQTKVLE